LCLSVILDGLLRSFTSMLFLTNSCVTNIPQVFVFGFVVLHR
jgi:hypothetical protein